MTASARPGGRIWELDALRGACILCVIVIHALFDAVYFFGLSVSFPPVYRFIQDNGGVIFVLLSGVCATLGSKSVRRGLLVFACGMTITLVTFLMARLGLAGREIVVRFGVLHLLGLCMILYPLFQRWPLPALIAAGGAMVLCGYALRHVFVTAGWLFPLGLRTADFTSGDYFPLLPHLGWFLLGSVLGRVFYKDRRSLLPGVRQDLAPVRFFCFCGRQSLALYLLHQPIVYGLMTLLSHFSAAS